MNHSSGEVQYPGQRLSLASKLCTVRYIGSVEGTKGTWLGVEWDDPQAGKHAGEHQGKQYFKCRSDAPRAASFIRPTRPADQPLSFLEALRKKYVDGESSSKGDSADLIYISGKVVEEVGFEKIRQQQAVLGELKVVLLDGLCVAGLGKKPWPTSQARQEEDSATMWMQMVHEVAQTCPKILELDLSRNTLEEWADVVGICAALPALRTLSLNGNRFRDLSLPLSMDPSIVEKAFRGVTDLSLDNTLMTWDEVVTITAQFPSLRILSLATNNFASTPVTLKNPCLQALSLISNNFSSLASLTPISNLTTLTTLNLSANAFRVLTPCPMPFPYITALDLSSNFLSTVSSMNAIQSPTPPSNPPLFPALISLRVSRNPFFTAMPTDTAHMLTLARIPTLKMLNYSPISPQERMNAELFYLSQISAELKQLEEGDTEGECRVLDEHPLWKFLYEKHDFEFSGARRKKGGEEMGPETLGGRLILLKIRARADLCGERPRGETREGNTPANVPAELETAPAATEENTTESHQISWIQKSVSVPKTVSIYRLKSVLGHAFNILPINFRIVWETGEWDPVGGRRGASKRLGGGNAALALSNSSGGGSGGVIDENDDDDAKWNVDSDSDSDSEGKGQGDDEGTNDPGPNSSSKFEYHKGRFVKREVEVLEGTSSVGFWIEGKEAVVRLEESRTFSKAKT